MMTKADFVFHVDPGHGWLEVDWTELRRLSLNPRDFSRYSYRRGNTFFLEEDCDASKFLAAWEAKAGRKAVLGEEYSNRDSFVRALASIHS